MTPNARFAVGDLIEVPSTGGNLLTHVVTGISEDGRQVRAARGMSQSWIPVPPDERQDEEE